MATEVIKNYVNGQWLTSESERELDVLNPANQEVLARVPLSTSNEVAKAIEIAHDTYSEWKRVPATERIQYLFKLKMLLEENLDKLAETITKECGKTLAESKGELRRAIENVEVACGIPFMMMGDNVEDIARGIDEHMIRQPLGVVAIISPFNFPGMIPFWFLPYAIATGNTCIVKPSERVPMTMHLAMELLEQTGIPSGVVNMVNGDKEAVDCLLEHPHVKAISFVGSTEVAKYIYAQGAANGKRVQAQGGAKNPVVIMPDADIDMTTAIVSDSAFGCAGQRCLANSMVITVGDAKNPFTESLTDAAASRVVGYGLEEGTQVGPVITPASRERIESIIGRAEGEGARILHDGRSPGIEGFEKGNFIRPTIIHDVHPESEVAKTEIFGPVLGMMHVNELTDAIELINKNRYGNMACIFTNSGPAARKFRNECIAGNIGINIGVAAPMAFFPFSGWSDSFFGDLHAQGKHAIEFYTQTKVVVERWPREWSRTF